MELCTKARRALNRPTRSRAPRPRSWPPGTPAAHTAPVVGRHDLAELRLEIVGFRNDPDARLGAIAAGDHTRDHAAVVRRRHVRLSAPRQPYEGMRVPASSKPTARNSSDLFIDSSADPDLVSGTTRQAYPTRWSRAMGARISESSIVAQLPSGITEKTRLCLSYRWTSHSP